MYFEYFFGKNILGFYSTNPSRLVGFLGNEYKIGTLIVGLLFPIISFWFYRLFYEKKNDKLIYLKKLFYLLSVILVVYILLPVGQRSIAIKIILSLIFFFYCFPFMVTKKKVLLILLFILLLFSIIWNNENFKGRFAHQIFWQNQEKVNNNKEPSMSDVLNQLKTGEFKLRKTNNKKLGISKNNNKSLMCEMEEVLKRRMSLIDGQ